MSTCPHITEENKVTLKYKQQGAKANAKHCNCPNYLKRFGAQTSSKAPQKFGAQITVKHLTSTSILLKQARQVTDTYYHIVKSRNP